MPPKNNIVMTPEERKQRQRESKRRWAEKNSEYQQSYYLANRQKFLDKSKAQREADPEQYSEYQKSYRQNNREALAQKKKGWIAANPGYDKARSQKRLARDPLHNRKYNLKYSYGITQEDYEAMLAAQSGKCAICGSSDPVSKHGRFAVDHCETPFKVRQLLCNPCNMGIGCLKHDPEILAAAIAYLKRHHPEGIKHEQAS